MLSKRFENSRAAKFLVWSFLTIVALMPIHTFFTTWLSSNTGGEEVIKAWKEILLLLNGFVLLYLLRKYRKVIWPILTRPVNVLIFMYLLWHLVAWAIHGVEADAAIAGIMINGRFLAIFVLAQVVIKLVKKRAFEKLAEKLFLTGAGLVALIGTLQALVLDKDILTHFGYGEDTVRPYINLDKNEDLVRINSTLRGPNPLGAYLILPILTVVNKIKRQIAPKWLYYALFMLVAMLFSFSRSAWLGLAVALGVYVLLVLSRYPRYMAYAVTIIILTIMLALSAVTIGQDSYWVQTYVYHDDPNTGAAVSSTEKHFEALGDASEQVLENPLGEGPGTAGPASRYNSETTRISENYFLQVGQEVGVIGLGLFLAINLVVAMQLWRQKHQPWPRLLLASFAGLTVVSLFLHGWADDATSLLWWSFAGLYYR
ncbi:MAG: O-antigen ligase family protein [Candidatus Saccharimonadales bacterium]|nr:O-antigen ligase family protein [Candidatus Saccharimonadales bacterium]